MSASFTQAVRETFTPAEHDCAQPCRGRHLSDENITWDFEEDIRDEKDEQGDVVIRAFHVEIFLQTLYSCVANVDSIDEGQRVED